MPDAHEVACGLYEQGVGTVRIAEQMGVHRTTIQRWLMQSGITLRKTSPQSAYNVRYFATYTPGSCYWAGFLLADGCVRKDRDTVALHLQARDAPHLHKFAYAIGLPSERVRVAATTCRINVNGAWFVRDLADNFGVVPQKSLTASFPVKVPRTLWPHVVRGIFDGDGSIGAIPGKYGGSAMNIVGTPHLLEALREIFYTSCGVRLKSGNRVPPLQHKNRCAMLSYSGVNADRILNWVYQGSSESTRLDRKFETWGKVRRTTSGVESRG